MNLKCWLLLDQQNNSLYWSATCLSEAHENELGIHTRPMLLREESFPILKNVSMVMHFKVVILKREQGGLGRKAGVSSSAGLGMSLQQAGFLEQAGQTNHFSPLGSRPSCTEFLISG